MTMDGGELPMILLDVLPLRPKRHVRGKFIEVLFIAAEDIFLFQTNIFQSKPQNHIHTMKYSFLKKIHYTYDYY